jgi:hypothetical protein
MKTKLFYILLTMTLFSSGCEKIELGKAFDCHMGNHYKVTNDLSFVIDSLNDSRCPENMVCGWPGCVYLFFNINLDNNNIDTILYEDPTGGGFYQFSEYKFSVLKVKPISIGTTTSKDITITMLITD